MFEKLSTILIIIYLKKLFDATNIIERSLIKKLFHCKMTMNSSMNTHVLRIIDYFKKLDQLGFFMSH
jgi:hypothetical protein